MSTADGTYGSGGTTDDRIGRITGQVTLILAGYLDRKIDRVMDVIPSALMYDIVQRGQEFLAEETLCIENSATLAMSSGSAAEPTGYFRMNFIEMSSGTALQATEIDVEEKDRLNRALTSSNQATSNVTPEHQYFYRYGGSIYTWPALTDGNYTMYYWGRPTTTVADGTVPETPAYMDTALIYWAVKELAPVIRQPGLAKEYQARFYNELARVEATHGRTQTVDHTTLVHDLK